VTTTPEQFDALADAMNVALNNHHHADQCGCRTWPESCHTAETFGSPYKPGHWDTSAFAIALPLVWDEIAKVANPTPPATTYALGSQHGGKDGSNWVVVGTLADGSPVLCEWTCTVDGRPDRNVELYTLPDVQAWHGLVDKSAEVTP